jgi:hypothetical protein
MSDTPETTHIPLSIPELNAKKIIGLLSERYEVNEWAFYYEVPNALSSAKKNVIDAMAIHCWDKGLPNGYSIAFEVKVDRYDVMRELADPTKRKFFIDHSNEYYFVCPKGLVKESEVPAEAGLMEVYETGLIITKIAQQRSNITYPPEFVASLLRKQDERQQSLTEFRVFKYAGKNITREEIEKIIKEKKLVREKEIYEKARLELVKEGDIVDTKPQDNTKVIKLIEQALELLK